MSAKKDPVYVSKSASTQMGHMTVSAMMDTQLMMIDYHAQVGKLIIIIVMQMI